MQVTVARRPEESNFCILLLKRRFSCINRAFSYDVTAAILVFQNNQTAAILVFQTQPVELNSFLMCVKTFFCSNKLA